jgi:CheY-specific phosphatase CheX
MGIKFFGQYLLEKGVITKEQLLDAVAFQEEQNIKFGVYSMRKGYITKEQLENVLKEQKNSDMKFGEIAIKFRYLTPEQVLEIATKQQNDHIYLGTALVMKGHLSREILEQELKEYQQEQADYGLMRTFPPKLEKEEDLVYLIDLIDRLLIRIADLKVKKGDVIKKHKRFEKGDYGAYVAFRGSIKATLLFNFADGVAHQITSSLLKEASEDIDIIEDAVKEFINIISGNISAKLAQEGKTVEFSVPALLVDDVILDEDQTVFSVPYHTVEGLLMLGILLG